MSTTQPQTVDYLRSKLRYDPISGHITWLVGSRNVTVGERAGSVNDRKNYRRIGIDGHRYLEHRIAWLLHFGVAPILSIDHINGDSSDNRITNLREATIAQQKANTKAKLRDGLLKGVRRETSGYSAYIQTNGVKRRLGIFRTLEAAHAAYCEAGREQWGDFFTPGPRP